MKKKIHILTGDALKSQLPSTVSGEIIVARLCLVDGPVAAASEEDLYKIRASFISENYPGFSKMDCLNNTVLEMRKVEEIPENSTVNLWFEDDLFCQVNFWFILHLLFQNNKNYNLYLVRPKADSAYSFGTMNQSELMQALDNKLIISNKALILLSQFWRLYQQNELSQLLKLAGELESEFPFLLPAIRAHQDRCVQPGRPKAAILSIIEKLDTDAFVPVFQAFCEQEKIYGFGDLQVKRLFDEVQKERIEKNGFRK